MTVSVESSNQLDDVAVLSPFGDALCSARNTGRKRITRHTSVFVGILPVRFVTTFFTCDNPASPRPFMFGFVLYCRRSALRNTVSLFASIPVANGFLGVPNLNRGTWGEKRDYSAW